MKKFKFTLCMICTIAIMLSTVAIAIDGWTERQEKTHEIAALAREMGLPEDNPIITEAKRIWWEDHYAKQQPARTYSDEDVRIIATVIYYEAWGGCSDRHRELVAAVVVNRVKSDRFPNTVYDVVAQPRQYLKAYADGTMTVPDSAWDTCSTIAEKALRGEVDCPDNVVFQAEFRQGAGVYEICPTSYSTTYFCYI